MARALSVTATVPIADLDDMRRSLEWWHDLLPETAREELAKEHARGNLLDEATLVDGRPSNNIDAVKPFGVIAYVNKFGPIEKAIAAADAIATSRAPHRSGHYARSMQWFVNGRAVSGLPTAEQIGQGGNAELVDLAPYADMVEIQVPRGVIFSAYTTLSRAFGLSLSIGYYYAPAAKFGGHRRGPGDSGKTFLNVPVLAIGNPAGNVRRGARARPAVTAGKRRAEFKRKLYATLKGMG